VTAHLTADLQVGAVTPLKRKPAAPVNYSPGSIGFEYISRAGRRPAQPERDRRIACLAGERSCTRGPPRGARRPHRDRLTGRGHHHHIQDRAPGCAGDLRAARGRLGEEPGAIGALWKQRLRWARGQPAGDAPVLRVWFRPHAAAPGSAASASAVLVRAPAAAVFMISASRPWSRSTSSTTPLGLARVPPRCGITNVLTYVFITAYSLMIDPRTGGTSGARQSCSRPDQRGHHAHRDRARAAALPDLPPAGPPGRLGSARLPARRSSCSPTSGWPRPMGVRYLGQAPGEPRPGPGSPAR